MAASIQNPIIIELEVTADASGGLSYICPRAGTIVDAWAVSAATTLNATLQVSVGGNAVTDAMSIASLDAVTRAATLDQTYVEVAAGDTLTVTANGASDRGAAYVVLLPAGEALEAA